MFAASARIRSPALLITIARRGYGSAASEGPLQRTVLYDFHVAHGGKMVPFAGWEMPVQYSDMGLIASHHHTRSKASLFDVSHMLQLNITGKDRVKFLDRLVVGDIAALSEGQGGLSLFTNEQGGIIDDTVISNDGDRLYVVLNAGCADKDRAHLEQHAAQHKSEDFKLDFLSGRGLLALQGPAAARALSEHVSVDLNQLAFMHGVHTKVAGVPCRVTRCGYTGEDGFEISIPREHTIAIAEKLLKTKDVALAGLGARDSLRLEAGLCLYGNDIDLTTSPIEARLRWTIGKSKLKNGGYLGSDVINRQIKEGVSRGRVGLVVSGAPARHGAKAFSADGKEIGEVTSGCPSPSTSKNIAMAYLSTPYAKEGTQVQVSVRGKLQPAVVTKMPFHPTNYFKKL